MIDHFTRIGLVVLVSCALAASAAAIPVEVNLVPVDNSAGGVELEGFTTTDIILTIPGSHTGSQMLIELDQGTIYQHPDGGHIPPNPGLVLLYPELAFDTYVAYGSHSPNGPYGSVFVIGEAVNLLTEARPLEFTDTSVNIAWAATPGNIPMSTDGFVAARVTLSNDAEGRWLYFASSGAEFTVIAPDDHPIPQTPTPLVVIGSGTIRSGELQFQARVPEPGSLGLLAAAFMVGFPLLGRGIVGSTAGR